ncbi:LicD family protein [Rubrivivax gelatinosus]|uniref:LicD/FKTN/FKRP nucleotidyltransferase domain-containing protein n=1 Tax=Rubrivivax gelatinosus TaxID=28068 RepID=A0ABS1DWU8_RUBGE|nr:LicD family protein [Rubrivivax gelatinosus]MBK1713943.1 hypothetical protein [Rubrivivax gelatinosus]
MAQEPPLDISAGRRLLFDVVELLDHHQIPYHLEGGTLLGLVRDRELLPWDHDLDISIPAADIDRLDIKLRLQLRLKLWRISLRKFRADDPAHGWQRGQTRIVKLAARHLVFARGWPRLDIFAKYPAAGRMHWVAKDRVMSVDARHYAGFDTVDYCGRRLRIPLDVEGYLSAKYGDWRIPVREWDCGKDERTIVGDFKG